ncbi:MAG: hypothetical protein LBE38_03025 [Deltaproteobacteria bacterium]|jgi:hypothetical protein|nr:hypothetical protein [Deltaproteobacteria bacterium]
MKDVRNTVVVMLLFVSLVLSLSIAAKAESPITFSGYLRIRTFGLGGFFPHVLAETTDKRSDKYAITRLRVNVVFKPLENLEVRWRFQGPTGARYGTSNQASDFSLQSMYFYGVIKTDYGNISIGRISYDVDSAGFQTLGYMPTWGFNAQANVFDRDSENDGILYRNDWDNGFGLKAFYVKKSTHGGNTALTYVKDADYDRFSIEPYYKWEGGGASIAVQYDRNQSLLVGGVYVERNYFYSINPAFIHQWQLSGETTFAIHAEAKFSWGSRRFPDEQDSERLLGSAAYVDFTLGYPQGNVSLAGWFANGNDTGPGADPDTRIKSLVDFGEGFYPFIIFYYGNNFIGNALAQNLEGNQYANHYGLALLGNHKLNDYVTINYGIGHFRKVADYIFTDGSTASKSLGTEFDLGLVVNILDNLQYSTKVGIFDSGSYYSERFNREDFDGTVWGWANEFLFTF